MTELALQHILHSADDDEVSADVPAPNLFASQELAAAGIDLDKFRQECAARDRTVRAHYAKLARQAAQQDELEADSGRLEKRASGERIEIKITPSGNRVKKVFGPTGDLISVHILEPDYWTKGDNE